jgi:hypothetical protein
MKAADILDCADLRTKEVDVPVWGRKVTIRELGLSEGLALFAQVREFDGNSVSLDGEAIARVVAWGVIDPATGERVFSDADVPKLARKNRTPLMFLYQEITSLSGEDAEKN